MSGPQGDETPAPAPDFQTAWYVLEGFVMRAAHRNPDNDQLGLVADYMETLWGRYCNEDAPEFIGDTEAREFMRGVGEDR